MTKPSKMTASQYKAIRKSIGSQEDVAKLLGVHPMTISNRERGIYPITLEAKRAIFALQFEQGVIHDG